MRESFDELDHIMSGLATLRPRMVQDLLEKRGSVKAKRLFMYLDEKLMDDIYNCGHQSTNAQDSAIEKN